jgi:hypothetical protein
MTPYLFCALLMLGAGSAAAGCRQALAIGLDVSGSVDAREFGLQTQGLARALTAPPIRAALLQTLDNPVSLAVFDWSGADHQRTILAWTEITDDAALDRAASAIATAIRIERSPATGVGAAMIYGDALLAKRPNCWRATLDLTGDGLNNSGITPRDVQLPDRRPQVTVNALVIGVDSDEGWDGGDPEIAQLIAWFRTDVIRGPDAFVEAALGFEDFAEAMERKLLRELSDLAVSALSPALPGPELTTSLHAAR